MRIIYMKGGNIIKKIPEGYQNEFYFVLEFNNKMIKDLNPLLREVIDDLFPNIKNDNLIIKSWRNNNGYEKGDILIKIDNEIRTISIKKGSRNSVHVESLEAFKTFLREQNVNEKIIYYYELFHYGVDKNNYKNILSSKEFCEQNKRKICKINKAFSRINIEKTVDRFILCGNNSNYRVDGIIYGVPNDFLWITKDEVIKIVKESTNRISTSVHIGCLFIQPLNRCINNNIKYKWCRDYIQVKWYSLFDDIIKLKSNL